MEERSDEGETYLMVVLIILLVVWAVLTDWGWPSRISWSVGTDSNATWVNLLSLDQGPCRSATKGPSEHAATGRLWVGRAERSGGCSTGDIGLGVGGLVAGSVAQYCASPAGCAEVVVPSSATSRAGQSSDKPPS